MHAHRPEPAIILPNGAMAASPAVRARRIQRSRRRGAPLPEGAVYVGRPTLWGNPFQDRQWKHAKSVKLHRSWLKGEIAALSLEKLGFCPMEVDALLRLRARVLVRLHELSGRDLACWCPIASAWCHADILLDLAPLHADLERFAS